MRAVVGVPKLQAGSCIVRRHFQTWKALIVSSRPKANWRGLVIFALALHCGPTTLLAADIAADFYVSPGGNDRWSGHHPEALANGTDGPVATFARAQQLVALLRRREPERARPVVVAVRGGMYFLDKPLRFLPDDSGTPKSPTIYQRFGEERPVLSGGVPISHWRVGPEGHWHTQVEEVTAGKWNFTQLFVNGERRERPHLPRSGYFEIAAPSGRSHFAFAKDDLQAGLASVGEAEILAFHIWSASRMRIASFDPIQSQLIFTGDAWEAFKPGNRYLVLNAPKNLSEPGQWYLNRPGGELTYIPMSGESPERAEVIAPRLEQVLVLQGDLMERRWVEHITFRGITFSHTNWTVPPGGYSFPQFDIGLNAAIAATGARQIAFENCAVRHTGGYAIAFGVGSRENRVENCEFVDLGAGGVKIGHAGTGSWDQIKKFPIDPELHVSRHVVRNCLIAHGGRMHPAGVGIWIGQSSHNSIEHNEIFDFYQTGISVGWTWGYGRSDAHDNDIGYNHVHTIGQGVTSDMGGIYLLGRQPGTIVHDNHVHHVDAFDYGGWGLYADEGAADIVFERNLVHHTKTGGFFQHFGEDNLVRNNIFAFGRKFQIEGTRPEPHLAFRFERNIVYWDNGSPLAGGCHSAQPPCKINFMMDQNVYWESSGKRLVFPGNIAFEEWQQHQKQDLHSLVADPLFVDAAQGDFRLHFGSPASRLGIEPLRLNNIGRRVPDQHAPEPSAVKRAFP
jgi:hypothetical protein